MQNVRAPLRPSETSLIIQAQIEGITPQDVLLRERLVRDGVPEDVATYFVTLLTNFRGSEVEMRNHLRENGAIEPVIDILVGKAMKAFPQVFADEAVRQTIGNISPIGNVLVTKGKGGPTYLVDIYPLGTQPGDVKRPHDDPSREFYSIVIPVEDPEPYLAAAILKYGGGNEYVGWVYLEKLNDGHLVVRKE